MGALVHLASYPKSGNTWVRALFAGYFGDREFDLDALSELDTTGGLRTLDDLLGVDPHLLQPDELQALQPAAAHLLHAELASHDGPVFQKLHSANVETAHGERLFPAGTCRVLYIVRNPLDVAASWAPFFGLSLDKAVDQLADPEIILNRRRAAHTAVVPEPLLSWSGHVRSWLDTPGLDLHVLRYEDLRAAPEAAFADALAFVGETAAPDRVAAAVEAARFDRLQAHETEEGFVELPPIARTPFFRRGRAGGWRDELSAAQARRVVEAHAETMRRLGYGDAVDEVEALTEAAAPGGG